MNKDYTIRNLILFIIIFGILGGLGYYYFFMKKSSSNDIINNIIKNVIKNDVENGVYVYKNKIGKTTNVYKGCAVSSIDDYIVVINEKYYKYHGSCMIMKYVGDGDTSTLKFKKEKDKAYTIELDKKTYNKDNNIREIKVGNNINSNITKANYNLVNFIIKNTEIEGNYYDFKTELTNSSNKYKLSIAYDKETKQFTYSISLPKESIYSERYTNIKEFPRLYFYNNNLIIVEKRQINGTYNSNILMYDQNGKTYDFSNSLPLKVNSEVLDNTYNILPRFDESNKVFYVVISKDNSFCDTQRDIIYYEFKLSYNFKTNGFGIPTFVKKAIGNKGKPEENEDCKYVQKYYLKEG